MYTPVDPVRGTKKTINKDNMPMHAQDTVDIKKGNNARLRHKVSQRTGN